MPLPLELGTIATATAGTLGSGQRGWQLTDGKLISWQLKALGLASAVVGIGIRINCQTMAHYEVESYGSFDLYLTSGVFLTTIT